MATHSSILAWRIPCTEELGRLRSMGLQRVKLKQLSPNGKCNLVPIFFIKREGGRPCALPTPSQGFCNSPFFLLTLRFLSESDTPHTTHSALSFYLNANSYQGAESP